MSFTTTIDITDFIDRAVLMLKANTILRDPITPADSLVTDVLAQEPAIEQSSNLSIIPFISVFPAKDYIRQIENFGKSDLDAAGAKYYHLEFYNVCIARGISRQEAQKKVQLIASIVRDVFQKNLRMAIPSTPPLLSPIAAINETVSIPYVLRSTDPNIQAINVICRPDVPISLT